MSSARGYTLIELLIIITIIAILITFGLSAFSRAGDRQTVQQAKELILSTLQNAQKEAYVGDKDCAGSLEGVQITFAGSTITSQSLCSDGAVGTQTITPIPSITFTTSPVIIFRPLDQGVTFGAGTSAEINYTISGTTYQVTVIPPGTVQYQGAI